MFSKLGNVFLFIKAIKAENYKLFLLHWVGKKAFKFKTINQNELQNILFQNKTDDGPLYTIWLKRYLKQPLV